MTERELLEKLLRKDHLSVPEKNLLPEGKAKASLLIEIIVNALEKTGSYPGPFTNSNSFGESCCLSIEKSGYLLMKNSEVGLQRFDIVYKKYFSDKIEAAKKFLELNYESPGYAGTIDGIPIDWTQ